MAFLSEIDRAGAFTAMPAGLDAALATLESCVTPNSEAIAPSDLFGLALTASAARTLFATYDTPQLQLALASAPQPVQTMRWIVILMTVLFMSACPSGSGRNSRLARKIDLMLALSADLLKSRSAGCGWSSTASARRAGSLGSAMGAGLCRLGGGTIAPPSGDGPGPGGPSCVFAPWPRSAARKSGSLARRVGHVGGDALVMFEPAAIVATYAVRVFCGTWLFAVETAKGKAGFRWRWWRILPGRGAEFRLRRHSRQPSANLLVAVLGRLQSRQMNLKIERAICWPEYQGYVAWQRTEKPPGVSRTACRRPPVTGCAPPETDLPRPRSSVARPRATSVAPPQTLRRSWSVRSVRF